MNLLLIFLIIVSFLSTLIILPFWIRKAKQINLVWKDAHKVGKTKYIAGSGGITVVLGFIIGTLGYIGIKTFYLKTTDNLIEILALLTSILLVAGIALIDDLFGWQHGGLSKKYRIILVIFSAIPLMVINVGESFMMGLDFGILYPLILIPLGVLGATTTFNFMEGYNGLGASQGILILTALSIVNFLIDNSWLSVIGLCMVGSLLAFYIFNKVPAKVFPGDVMTYPVGALIAIIAILGNIEKIAILFFIPYIIEFILKSRGGYKKQSLAKLNPDGSISMPYNKIYGLEHLAIYLLKKYKPSKKVYERDVVWAINVFQILVILITFLINKNYLF